MLAAPWTNVAGMLGFSGGHSNLLDLSRFGAFISNPISFSPRRPCHPPRLLHFAGGFLLHTGHPNPGLSAIIRRQQRLWNELPCSLIIHLLGEEPREVAAMVEQLEDVEAVDAIEISFGETDSQLIREILLPALRSELPILANFPLNSDISPIQAAAEAGVAAISLGPPRGSLPGPEGQLVSGRLFGPGLWPYALGVVARLSSLIALPIIASGGLYSKSQIEIMLRAGAKAVQLDGILWTEPEKVLGESGEL